MTDKTEKALSQTLHHWWLFSGGLGLNATIIEDNKGSWNLNCGYIDPHTMEPLEPNQLCYIYSITKTFSAALVMKLTELGLIDVDAPIKHYLNEVNLAEEVTVSRLLNHTSGLGDFSHFEAYQTAMRSHPEKPFDDTWVLEKVINQQNLLFASGCDWSYSNAGYMLLRHLLERCSKTNYEALLFQHICQPLALNDTYHAGDQHKTKLTKGYSRVFSPEGKIQEVTQQFNPAWVKTGLISSTTADVARMYHQLFTGNLLSTESLSKMAHNQQLIGETKTVNYGYGFDIFDDGTKQLAYGHAGGGPGFTSAVKHFPDIIGRPISIAIFCNTSINVPFHSLFDDFVNVLKGQC